MEIDFEKDHWTVGEQRSPSNRRRRNEGDIEKRGTVNWIKTADSTLFEVKRKDLRKKKKLISLFVHQAKGSSCCHRKKLLIFCGGFSKTGTVRKLSG